MKNDPKILGWLTGFLLSVVSVDYQHPKAEYHRRATNIRERRRLRHVPKALHFLFPRPTLAERLRRLFTRKSRS